MRAARCTGWAKALGVIPDRPTCPVAGTLRAQLSRSASRAGRFALFVPALLKPRAAAMRAQLWALHTASRPALPTAGLVSLPGRRRLARRVRRGHGMAGRRPGAAPSGRGRARRGGTRLGNPARRHRAAGRPRRPLRAVRSWCRRCCGGWGFGVARRRAWHPGCTARRPPPCWCRCAADRPRSPPQPRPRTARSLRRTGLARSIDRAGPARIADWQRLDKWLWCARFMKARADCARLAPREDPHQPPAHRQTPCPAARRRRADAAPPRPGPRHPRAGPGDPPRPGNRSADALRGDHGSAARRR